MLHLAQLERCNYNFENFGHYSLNIARYKTTRTLLLNFANENKQNMSNYDNSRRPKSAKILSSISRNSTKTRTRQNSFSTSQPTKPRPCS